MSWPAMRRRTGSGGSGSRDGARADARHVHQAGALDECSDLEGKPDEGLRAWASSMRRTDHGICRDREKTTSGGAQPKEKVMIDLDCLAETDLLGRFVLQVPDGDRFSGYYHSLDTARPLFYMEEWLASVTGFYVNVAGNFNAVRLSYFTPSPELPQIAVEDFAEESAIEFEVAERPHAVRISRKYGNEEMRFRRFLSTYSPIGLEIMEADLLHSRRLFATFRWQVMRARQPYRPHFSRAFEGQSPFYNSLSVQEQDQFWRDLEHWPNPPQVDWAHLFVNMVLGCDWNSPQVWRTFLSPEPPLPIPEINSIVEELGFSIPDGWEP